MLSLRAVWSLVFVFCYFQAEGQPVRVAFDWPPDVIASTHSYVHVRAVRIAGYTSSALPVETEASGGGVVLDLGEGVWQVQASVPGYWSQDAEVAVSRQRAASVRLALWPAAVLHGDVVTADGEPLPHDLQVHLSAVARFDDGRRSSPSHADLRCPIEATTWSCPAPAGLFDVQLKAGEYAPRYEWALNLNTGESIDFGRTVLRRTASVFGRAVRKDGSDPPGPCHAILRPDLERHGPLSDPGVAAERIFNVPVSRRGYFQIVGMLPGRHVLAVTCPAATVLYNVRVQADIETRIDPPLHLDELSLEIAVTPNTDRVGRPWKLSVYQTAPHFRRIANGDITSGDGRWSRHGVMAGRYHVVVSDSDGTKWFEKYFDLRTNTAPLFVRVGSMDIAGRVFLKSQPVRARLTFFNNAGGESAAVTSDANGHFQGLLPVPPSAIDNTWTVEAQVVQPPIHVRVTGVSVQPVPGRGSAWLDLELPTVAVRGTVVSPDGQPQRSIQVSFEDSRGGQTTTSTDDAGRFEMQDLPPGKYNAWADSPDGASDRIPFEIAEGGGSELKLVLNPFHRFSFYVVSSNGPVDDAAVQVWIAPGVPRAFTRTDEQGRFEITLPPRTAEVGLTIGAPGYALKLLRIPIPSDADEAHDGRSITLDASAGALQLTFQPPGRHGESAGTFYLVHNRAIQDARSLVGWGTGQGEVVGKDVAIIKAIEPGAYALCRVDPGQVAALWSGQLPADHCWTGSMEQDETLTLSSR